MSQFLESLLNHPVMESLGWVLLHFLWQGVGIAVVLVVVLAAMRRASANARYLASCTALLGTVLLPAFTYSVLPDREVDSDRTTPVVALSQGISSTSQNAVEMAQPAVMVGPDLVVLTMLPELPVLGTDDPLSASTGSQFPPERFDQFRIWLRPWVPFLTCAWLVGVVALSIRLLVSWLQVQRLQCQGIQSAREEHLQLLGRLATRLGIRRTVQLLESVIVEVPTVIGWLKPVILLPVASINSLTVQQLEAILAHELAHIPSTPEQLAPRWLTGAAAMLIAAALVGVPLLTKSQAEPAVAQNSTSQQNENLKAAAEKDKQLETDEKPKLPATTNLDKIKPAEIADRIEEARKRYASVEYTATIEQTRNTSAFQPDVKPTLVKGGGSITYRADGERWFCDRTSFSYQVRSTKTYPTQTVSSFDGSIHRVLDRNVLKICEEDNGAHQYAPTEFFWKAGISSDWLLSALRRPEAKLIERIQMAETSCLNVKVEWKPGWSEAQTSFDIMICPEQDWLVRRVTIEFGGQMFAEWSINEVAKTESGLHYPVEFKVLRPETDNTPSTIVNISKFQERMEFEPNEFQVPNPIGIDIVDYRSGFAWHNDPWWNELAPWARENLDWPQPSLQSLTSLESYSLPELAGTAAPELVPGEWLNQPGKLAWDRPERTVTVLYFFGGRLIEPTPEQVAALSHLQRKYADGGLEIIGIASHYETPEIRQAIRELVPPFPIMIDANANEVDISKDVVGAEWGANFVRYQLKPYTGTVIVNKAGKVMLMNPAGAQLISGMSQLEGLIREELMKSNGSADGPGVRSAEVNRISRLLRGTAARPDEFAAADNDQSPLWLQNAQQAIVSTIPDAQREFVKSRGLTVQATLQDLSSNSTRIPDVAWYRLEDEWKKRAAAAKGTGIINGRIRQNDGAQFTGTKAMLVVEPVLRTLISNTPGGWMLSYDRERIRKVDSNDAGEFTIDDLPKGSYQISVVVPGKPRAKRTVHLVSHESKAELNIDLFGGDEISGKVTDSAGSPVPKATVKAVKRFITSEAVEAGQHTTENLPSETQTASVDGVFVFESLFEGAYQFEVSAEGYETTTTEAVPAGFSDLRVILKPVVPDQAAAAARAILGTVIHQGQPVANARVGLQASSILERFGNNEVFVATAVTGNDGQYVLTVPNAVDSKSSIAVWAVAEGYQPTRKNLLSTVSEAAKWHWDITLAKSPGCALQISDATGTPISDAAVTVPTQTLPESIDFEIPKDWRDLVSGKTDVEGIVSLPYVVPEAMTEVRIQIPGQDSEIVATGNYFLNTKPAAKAPHHHFKLPKSSGSLEGKIEVTGGQLPQDLILEISTETSMTDEPRRLQTLGVAKAKVGADGRFKVNSIAAGTLTIKPFLPVDQALRAELPRSIRVVAGKTTPLSINVVKGVHLRGRIVAADSGDGLAGIRFQILYGSSAQEPQNMHNSIDIVTDDQGRYQAWVPPGRVLLRISWRDQHYSQVEYWSPRASGLGSAFEVPEAEEFELEPITFVPSKEMNGQLVDQDGQPLMNWRVFGYPEIPGKPTEYVTNCFGGTTSDGDGKFSSLYPSTFPPAIWKVSHQDWPTPHESNEREWIAKVISEKPLILQVDTKPAPPAPLRNAANSGDMADDEAIAASGLTGTWSLQWMTWNGIKVPEEQCRQTTMTIEGHQLTIDKYWNISFTSIDPVTRVAEGGFTAETGLAGAVQLSASTMPYEIDLTINGIGAPEQEEGLSAEEQVSIRSGQLKVRGICEIKGDELQLCLSEPRMPEPLARPTEFSAGESSERTLFVLKRIRP